MYSALTRAKRDERCAITTRSPVCNGASVHVRDEFEQPRAYLEPHVPALAPTLSDDPIDLAPSLRRTGLTDVSQPIREPMAAGSTDTDPHVRLRAGTDQHRRQAGAAGIALGTAQGD